MKHPVQALLWEQWRLTWKAIPFTVAMGIIILVFIPQALETARAGREWSLDVGIIICGILCGIFAMVLQSEGGRRGGAISDRHFTLPIVSRVITAVPIFVFFVLVFCTTVACYAYVASRIEMPISQGFLSNIWSGISPKLQVVACFVLAYGLTIRSRHIPIVRIVLILLILFALVYLAESLSRLIPPLAVTTLALALSIPTATLLVNRDRHSRVPTGKYFAFLFKHLPFMKAATFSPAATVPATIPAALRWNDLRGRNKIILPCAIAAVGIVIFLVVYMTVTTGAHLLQTMKAPGDLVDAWGALVGGLGAIVYLYSIVRLGTQLAGPSNPFAPWSPETSYWKRHPVPSSLLSTTKLQSIMLQCLCWSLSLYALVAIGPVVNFIINLPIGQGMSRLAEYLKTFEFTLVFFQGFARPYLITALVLWSGSGLISAVAVTGRRWFFNVGLSLLALSGLAVARIATISNQSDYFVYVPLLENIAGSILIAAAIVPLIITIGRGLASRSSVLSLAIFCLIAEFVIMEFGNTKVSSPDLFTLGIYAIPFAPIGLLPMAVHWGRRL